jgi:predicted dienelactone hydrolase
MSFGGTSSASACNQDTRCKAALNLDGEEFDWSLYDAATRMPIAILHSDWVQYPLFGPSSANPAFNVSCDYAYEPWSEAGRSANVYRARLVGTRHIAFTDLPLSARGALKSRVYGDSDAASVLSATNDFVLGFFDASLKGERRDFPAAVYRRHAGLLLPHTTADVRAWWTSRR